MKLLSSQDFCIAADVLLSERAFKDADDVLSQLENLLQRTHGFESKKSKNIIVGSVYQHRYNKLIFAEVISDMYNDQIKIIERDDIESIGCGETTMMNHTVFLNNYLPIKDADDES